MSRGRSALAASAAVLGGLLLRPPTPAAAGLSPTRCASIKAKAAGAAVARSLACFSSPMRTGAGTPFACLADVEAKLGRAFAKADRKGSCGVTDDATVVASSVVAFAEGVAVSLFPVDAADSERRCATRKLRRTGAYGKGRLRCWARALHMETAVDSECLETAATRLRKAFETLEARGGCPTLDDEPDVRQAVDGFSDAVAGFLAPGTTTSTSSTSTTMEPGSTTTTMPGGTTTTTELAGTTTTSTVPSVVSLSLHVQPILTANCAVAGCHAGVVPAEGMDLRAGHAYGSIVNVPSQECPLFKRVLPGSPTQSYLGFKITGPPQPCFSGNQMPSGGAPPLAASDQLLIRAWIEQGALDN